MAAEKFEHLHTSDGRYGKDFFPAYSARHTAGGGFYLDKKRHC
jgi:hypothetical protein